MALSESLYHVGIVVPDLEVAKAHLTELLGLSWGNNVDIAGNAVRDGDGRDFEVPFRLCFSRQQPHIELIQELPGTIWECNDHSNLHHIGLWSDAIADDSAAFDRMRCPLALCARHGDVAPVQWAYHRDVLGFNLELIDAATKDEWQQFTFGAQLA
jgi:hypothetical protein